MGIVARVADTLQTVSFTIDQTAHRRRILIQLIRVRRVMPLHVRPPTEISLWRDGIRGRQGV
jgi:hypothetical protein